MKISEFKEKLDQDKEVMVIDVREEDEFVPDDTITGAVNMPMGKIFVQATKGELPKDKQIVTACKTGTRCEIVARELKEKGYNIDHLEGGIDAWKQADA
jgi:rhodanese-related sulfurtransferase